MLAVAKYRRVKRSLPPVTPMSTTRLQKTYNVRQCEVMIFITGVWDNDITNETILNCWRNTGILKSSLTSQLATKGDGFSIMMEPSDENDFSEALNEIHGAYSSQFWIESSFNNDNDDIYEEVDFFEDDSVAIAADQPEDDQGISKDGFEEQERAEQIRLKLSVEHLRKFWESNNVLGAKRNLY